MSSVMGCIGYIRAIARKLSPLRHYDDLVQEGVLAYLRCERKDRPGSQASLLTYARKAIRGAMLDYLAGVPDGEVIDGDTPDRDRGGRLAGCLADLAYLVARLPEREGLIFQLVRLEGKSLTEAAKLCGLRSKEHAFGLLSQAEKKLKLGAANPEFAGPLRRLIYLKRNER